MDIFEEISKLKRQGRRAALATIVNVRGSIPSVAAAKMLVFEDGSILGTVGGGCVEGDVRRGAQEVMRDEKPRTYTFNLDQTPDDDTGLVCGGSLQVFVEPILPTSPLFVFGAGHVGLAICRVGTLAGFDVTIVDDREAFANRERFPEAREVLCGDWDSVLAGIAPPDSAFLAIVTRGHRHDMGVLRWALETPARYIGMIGSGRKVLAIFDQLTEEGIPREHLERVYAPIGLEIGAVTPEEIAVSVVAEIIGIRRRSEVALPHSRNRIREHVTRAVSDGSAG
jgi:xanthine dehydrogenase accessory factor